MDPVSSGNHESDGGVPLPDALFGTGIRDLTGEAGDAPRELGRM